MDGILHREQRRIAHIFTGPTVNRLQLAQRQRGTRGRPRAARDTDISHASKPGGGKADTHVMFCAVRTVHIALPARPAVAASAKPDDSA